MYTLVKSHDSVYYVCKSNLITIKKGVTKIVYSDGGKYAASIIARNDNKTILHEIRKNILTNKPHILCNKINFEKANKNMEKESENDDNEKIFDDLVCIDVDEKINYTDENEYNKEIVSMKKENEEMYNVIKHDNINQAITLTDHRIGVQVKVEKKNCNRKTAYFPTSCNIKTIILKDNDGNCFEAFMLNKDCNIEKNWNILIPFKVNFFNENVSNETTDTPDNVSEGNPNILMSPETGNVYNIVEKDFVKNFLKNIAVANNISSIDLHNGSVFMNAENCARKLSSNAAEELTTSKDTSFTCQSQVFNKGEIDNSTSSQICELPTAKDISSMCQSISQVSNKGEIDDSTLLVFEELTTSKDTSFICQSMSQVCNEGEINDSAISQICEELTTSKDIFSTCQSISQVFNEGKIDDSTTSQICDVENDKEDNESEDVPSKNKQNALDNNESRQKHKLPSNITEASTSCLDTSQINNSESICNNEMYVESSVNSVKRNACVFCTKLQTQLARHLEMKHSNEPEVKKFAILPKHNKERKKMIEALRKEGNFKFNTNSNVNNKQIIVCRRPNKKFHKLATDFIACAKCKGFFVKTTIRSHSRNCFKKYFKYARGIMVMNKKVTGRLHSSASDILRTKIFPVMREDNVTCIIRYDELLISYANKLCIKYKYEYQHNIIRSKLRILGRFLLILKQANKDVENFTSIYDARVYDDCINTINIIAKYNDRTRMYEAPAIATNLLTSIKCIGNLLITEYIKKEEKEKLVKDFLELLDVYITKNVKRTETQSVQKRHKKTNLPSLEDIRKLYKYLEDKRIETFNALQQSFSYNNWISLAEVTLISVQLFNKRWAGEIQRILIEDFQNYEKLNKNMCSNIYKSLSEKSKQIVERYIRIYIKDKLGRPAPILLSHHLFQCINLILKYREKADICEKNPYVFGLPGYEELGYRYLKTCSLMRKFAKECNASRPETLRSTVLRKNVATYSIQLNLNDTKTSDFAASAEHSEEIRKNHCRQPLTNKDILKISHYLVTVQETQQHSSDESSLESSDNESCGYQSEESDFIENEDKENTSSDTNSHTMNNRKIGHEDSNKKRKRSISPCQKFKKVRWSMEEKEAVLEAFAKYMEEKRLPSLKEIQQIKKKYDCLTRRTLPQIKTWIHNKQKAA